MTHPPQSTGCREAIQLLAEHGFDGRRTVLGVSVSDSEAEVHWREFFKGFLARGLHGSRYIVSASPKGRPFVWTATATCSESIK